MCVHVREFQHQIHPMLAASKMRAPIVQMILNPANFRTFVPQSNFLAVTHLL